MKLAGKKRPRMPALDSGKMDVMHVSKRRRFDKSGRHGSQGLRRYRSPSIVINGQVVSPSRTPEGYKTAICDSFNEMPEECLQALSSDGAAPDGGC
jgi:hypothetical protein